MAGYLSHSDSSSAPGTEFQLVDSNTTANEFQIPALRSPFAVMAVGEPDGLEYSPLSYPEAIYWASPTASWTTPGNNIVLADGSIIYGLALDGQPTLWQF